MNTTTTNTLIRCALSICSTTVPSDEKLDAYTHKYLHSRGFTIEAQSVTDHLKKNGTGAKLYGIYRDDIRSVQRLGLIQELYRTVWIYYTVSIAYETISPAQLLSAMNDKFEEEAAYDRSLDRNKFTAFRLIDKEFGTVEAIRTSGKVLKKFSADCFKALKKLSETFSSLDRLSYMAKVYTADPVITEEPPVSAPVPEERKVVAEEPAPVETEQPQISQTELQLRDEIRMLKSEKHALEVKLSYAKKDSVREFLCTLMSYGWNCPLGELYRLLKDDETPEKIKGIINNFFMSLGDENIKICRDRVGDIITLSESNQKSYDPYKNEQLYLGDKAEIFYPGYRYDHEVMVRPIVRKVKGKDNGENG